MHPSTSNTSRQSTGRYHLRALALAILLVVALAAVADGLMGRFLSPYVERLAPTGEDDVVQGLFLTRLAAEQPNRLLLLGSSELNVQDKYHAVKLFASRPTGFTTWVLGSGYRQSIHNLLLLSALGPELKGKRLVLFVSPSWFTRKITDKAYRKNFSPLQAYEFTYDSTLSPELKHAAAKRLLQIGSPGTDDPLLRIALAGLARGDLKGRIEYYVGWPIGKLTLLQLHFRDRARLVRLILTKHLSPTTPVSRPTEIDWDQLWEQAGRDAAAQTAGNRFGISDEYYQRNVAPKLTELEGSARSEAWVNSTEWGDLDLVLRSLKELGAEPLFISLPVLGTYQDFKGHSAADRTAYYAQVRQRIEAAGFPVVDLSRFENEPGFYRDPWHQGWKGTLLVAETIDRFYHGEQPDPGR